MLVLLLLRPLSATLDTCFPFGGEEEDYEDAVIGPLQSARTATPQMNECNMKEMSF